MRNKLGGLLSSPSRPRTVTDSEPFPSTGWRRDGGSVPRRRKLAPTLLASSMALALVTSCADGGAGTGPTTSTAVDPPTSTTAPTTTGPTTPTTGPTTTAPATTAPAPTTTVPAGPQQYDVTTVASGLEVPWGIAFLGDGRAVVSQRKSGQVVAITPDGTISPVLTLPSVDQGEGGALGLAIAPGDTGANPTVYAYITTAGDNRVVKFTLGSDTVTPVLTGIPAASNHNGGRIAFGPDGFLYVATGDATVRPDAQDQTSLAGKILRITTDGQPAPGNPFPGSPVWSLGHRNVQGLTWDAEGRLYESELGQDTYDEVNIIVAGANYGWPEVEGVGGDPTYVDPISVWTTDESSPSGALIAKDSALVAWNGDLFVAGLRGARLWRLDLNPDGTVAGREALLTGEYGRLRTVVQAPDGSIWVATSNRDGRGDPASGDDRILRISPK